MLHPVIQVLFYALLAGLSPLAFAATIAVIQAGQPKALAFGTGFVVPRQLLTCSLLVAIGVTVTGSTKSRHPGIQFALEVALAVGLIWLAGRVRRTAATKGEAPSERTHRLLERLGRLRTLTTLAAGLLLGIGAPKRLVLAALAATTITTAGVGSSGAAALVVAYVAVATALVWGPVILFVLLGERVVSLMERAQREVARHHPQVTVYALLVLATLFTFDALDVLLTQIV